MDIETHEEVINATLQILTLVKEKIIDGSDITTTRFNSVSEFRFLLDTYVYQVKHGDLSAFQILKSEFAPTASLQEHSISNGWAREFLILAKRFDNLYNEINK